MYEWLLGKFQPRPDNMQQSKNETVKNVHKRTPKSEGNMIFIGDDNWNLVLNMMIGIQMAVRSVKGFQEMIYE
jgi:3-deoxy-D-manno-octulosonate 8-phosphate phosphatase KdsC-like HAD superfamily phosphatase